MVQSQNRMQQIPLSSYVQKCSNYKKKWHQSRHHSALSYSLHLLGLQVIYIQTAWQWQVVIQTACQWHILINIQHDKSTSIGLPHSRQTVWHAQLKYFVKKKKKKSKGLLPLLYTTMFPSLPYIYGLGRGMQHFIRQFTSYSQTLHAVGNYFSVL